MKIKILLAFVLGFLLIVVVVNKYPIYQKNVKTSEITIKSDEVSTENSKEKGGYSTEIEVVKRQMDYSGKYTDKQGTPNIYSELELQLQCDDSYAFTMAIYRVTSIDGIATYKDEDLHFVTDIPTMEGNIVIDGDSAEVTISKSDFVYMPVGSRYSFLDGKE